VAVSYQLSAFSFQLSASFLLTKASGSFILIAGYRLVGVNYLNHHSAGGYLTVGG
jgi:hypothetical protein